VTVRVALFDLDGTISDSAPGILGSLRLAFDDLGIPHLDAVTERRLLGPPFSESLPPLIGAARIDAVIERYRTHYAIRQFDTRAYDGIEEVLADLRRRGVTLAVATSKPEFHAVPIVEHLGLDGYFLTIGGDTLGGTRSTKARVIAEVLDRLGAPEPRTVVMVGDRLHDVAGAHAHRIPCLGAEWGYGGPAELRAAGADELFAVPADLLAAHGRLFRPDDDAPAA
jgi:phosphoglycolate phosphatase